MPWEPVLPKYETYLRDESRFTGSAEEIFFPESTQELAEAFKQAKDGQVFTIQGGRTGVAGAAVPACGCIINLSKMDTLDGRRAQAGVTLQQIQDYNIRHGNGNFFAPNPTEKSATLGGAFACDAGGMNALRYGSVGNHIDTLTWVTLSGEVWQIQRGQYVFTGTGCMLPSGEELKCKTDLPQSPLAACIPRPGMDLIDFLAGSEGSYGVATELEYRLTPLPKENWGVVYFFKDHPTAIKFADSIAKTEEITAVEYYDEAVIQLVRENKTTLSALKTLPEFPPGIAEAIYIELGGDDVDAIEETLMEHLETFVACGGDEEDTWAAGNPTEIEKFQTLRHSVPELLNTEVDRLRLSISGFTKTATDFTELAVDAYHQGIKKAGVRGYVFGHILDKNHLHCNLLPENEAQWDACRALIQEWAAQVVEKDGLLAAENGVGKTKQKLIRDFLPDELTKHYALLKQTFDPEGKLAASLIALGS